MRRWHFGWPMARLYRGGEGEADGRPWRVRRHRRSDRMRKIDAAQRGGRPAEAGLGTVKIFDQPLRASTGTPAICSRPMRCFPGRPRSTMSRSASRSRAPRARRRSQRAQAWLTSVGLGAFANRYPHMLSGGQRKRVGLAQVLIRDPKILLMDEPFGPLDAQTRQIMGNLLLELWNADRKAVLFVTHDLEEAIALADRVVIMSAGPSRAHHRRLAGVACRARAISSKCGWRRSFTHFTVRYGVF